MKPSISMLTNRIWILMACMPLLFLLTQCGSDDDNDDDGPELSADFTMSRNPAYAMDSVYFNPVYTDADDYTWYFGDGKTSTTKNTGHMYWEEGEYEVALYVTRNEETVSSIENLTVQPPYVQELTATVYSEGLEGNILGDSPNRLMTIYLPKEYKDSLEKHYPVLYFLHGYWQSHETFFGFYARFTSIINKLIQSGEIDPMIVVSPNSQNKYLGSWYTNSTTTGSWEDFIIEDVVQYMDANYRTIPSKDGRGIAGHSMGGYGTIKLAMLHPDLFQAAYALSPADMVFEDVILGTMFEFLIEAVNSTDFDSLTWEAKTKVAAAAAYAPNPDAHYYGDFPITTDGVLIDSTWQKWLEHDLYTLLPQYTAALNSLEIRMDCGDQDPYLIAANRRFAQALIDHEVGDVFTEYQGTHTNKLSERLEYHVIPFFNEVFEVNN